MENKGGKDRQPSARRAALRSLAQQGAVLLVGVALFFIQGPRGFVWQLWDRVYDPEDTVGNYWILTWLGHAATTPDVSLWDPPIFYPAKNTLTFTETLLGNLWIYLPVEALTGSQTFAVNMVILAAFALSMYAVFVLVYELTGSFWAGLFAGALFAFNPYRWANLPRIQLAGFCWSAAALVYLHRFFRSGRARHLWGALAALWVQLYVSICLGLMLFTLLCVAMLLHLLAERRDGRRLFWLRDWRLGLTLLAGAAASLPVLYPLAAPYLETLEKLQLSRSLEENALHAAEPLSFLLPAANIVTFPGSAFASWDWLYHLMVPLVRGGKGAGGGESAVFPGAVPVLLALAAVWLLVRRGGRLPPGIRTTGLRTLGMALAMGLLVLGPSLIWMDQDTGVPLPYRLFYQLVPGARALRAPARFFQPLLLCLAVLGGITVAALEQRLRGRSRLLPGLALAALAALLALDYRLADAGGISHTPDEGWSKVYPYLRSSGRTGPVAELPAGPTHSLQYLGMHHLHWRPTLGGMGSWTTEEYQELANTTNECPDRLCLDYLARSPAQTLVIHLYRYPEPQQRAWLAVDPGPLGFRSAGRKGLSLVWERLQR